MVSQKVFGEYAQTTLCLYKQTLFTMVLLEWAQGQGTGADFIFFTLHSSELLKFLSHYQFHKQKRKRYCASHTSCQGRIKQPWAHRARSHLCLLPFLTRSSMSRIGVTNSCSRLFSAGKIQSKLMLRTPRDTKDRRKPTKQHSVTFGLIRFFLVCLPKRDHNLK